MKGPLDIHQYLLGHDVPHEIVRLGHSASTVEHLAEILALPAQRCVAVHAFHALTPTADVVVVLLTAAGVDTDEATYCELLVETLAAELGTSTVIAPAGAELVSSRTDYLAGHLAPLLLPPDVLVVATPELECLGGSIVYTATGDAGTALAIPAADLLALAGARTASRALDTASRALDSGSRGPYAARRTVVLGSPARPEPRSAPLRDPRAGRPTAASSPVSLDDVVRLAP